MQNRLAGLSIKQGEQAIAINEAQMKTAQRQKLITDAANQIVVEGFTRNPLAAYAIANKYGLAPGEIGTAMKQAKMEDNVINMADPLYQQHQQSLGEANLMLKNIQQLSVIASQYENTDVGDRDKLNNLKNQFQDILAQLPGKESFARSIDDFLTMEGTRSSRMKDVVKTIADQYKAQINAGKALNQNFSSSPILQTVSDQIGIYGAGGLNPTGTQYVIPKVGTDQQLPGRLIPTAGDGGKQKRVNPHVDIMWRK
jgi:neutral trehalase